MQQELISALKPPPALPPPSNASIEHVLTLVPPASEPYALTNCSGNRAHAHHCQILHSGKAKAQVWVKLPRCKTFAFGLHLWGSSSQDACGGIAFAHPAGTLVKCIQSRHHFYWGNSPSPITAAGGPLLLYSASPVKGSGAEVPAGK